MAEAQKKQVFIKPQGFSSGTVLFRQGDERNKDLYLLHKGKIGVYVDEIEVAIINTPGTFVGESAALLDEPRNASCVVLSDSYCTVFPGKIIDKIIVQHPAIGLNLLKLQSKRLKRTTQQFISTQKEMVNAKRELNKLKGISTKIAEYDVLTQLLLEMGYVGEEQVEEARKRQAELASQKTEVPVPTILVDMGAITMFEMIQGIKLQREIGERD